MKTDHYAVYELHGNATSATMGYKIELIKDNITLKNEKFQNLRSVKVLTKMKAVKPESISEYTVKPVDCLSHKTKGVHNSKIIFIYLFTVSHWPPLR